mgnify:CR=1 FL=1
MESFVEAVTSIVRKRDGFTTQGFQREKVVRAIRSAWLEARKTIDDVAVERVAQNVFRSLPEGTLDVETIQDTVEICLMKDKQFDVAKAYIVYRHQRSELREVRKSVDPAAIADYVALSKYSRYMPEMLRRETYDEAIDRVQVMHTKKFPKLREKITWAFDLVRNKRVLPSMRSVQFGGEAIESVNCRAFNCCATLIDRPEAFSEVLYLLLCGCGVGFSVQIEHVEKLPKLAYIDERKIVHHTIADTIEGWAEALKTLVKSHLEGHYVEFSYASIRPEGAPLKTSGGKAPGHFQLKKALEAIRSCLKAASGRRLRPIECYDILCHAADAVLSGGIRRSAMICMFSLNDSEMLYAKTGKWLETAGWRQNSNNSVVLQRGQVSKREFFRIFTMTQEWGEPGFIFSNSPDHLFNPCVEAALYPILHITPDNVGEAQQRTGRDLKVGDKLTGFSFCNLTSINAAKFDSMDDFLSAAEAATFIGTLQASYTKMPYLGGITEMIAERDALLGVSMTGMLDKTEIACNPTFQSVVAAKIVEWNKEFAELIGVNQAARTTCIKPEGTGSWVLGGVASGHHAHHSRRYIRRVIAKSNEPIFQFFKSKNPHMCQLKPNGDWVVEFPIEAPQGAVIKADLSAIQFLEMVRSTQLNWVRPGTARLVEDQNLTHNVSNTVHVADNEWDSVAEYLYECQDDFAAVSLLGVFADKAYAYAPFEAVLTPADEMYWNRLVSSYVPVDYTEMVEAEDGTALSGEAACSGGACEIAV